MTIQEIKLNFPDEWILLGNPQFSDSTVIGGEVVLHGKNKTELAQKGSLLRENYQMLKFIYTGQMPVTRRIGILKRV
jgi:hypothetical protein